MTSGQFPDLLGGGSVKKRVPKAVLRTKKGKEKIATVMREYKQGALRLPKQAGGQKVRNRKQALAIALSEAYRKVKGKK
jgi:hypothetical protein